MRRYRSPVDAKAALLAWYDREARDLPWRRTRDPYAIVVAEFMLQQTTVRRVTEKWRPFLDRFPTWSALAKAAPGAAIDAWRGLGYNRRALRLRELALEVMDRGGTLPQEPDALRRLPGVGTYTVSAIRAFVLGHDVATIDVNLRRVLGRWLFGREGVRDREVAAAAQAILPPGQAKEWNQALMDIGATICGVRAPRCLLCPIHPECRWAASEKIHRDDRSAGRRQGRFAGSSRQVRGRIVDLLRDHFPEPLSRAAAIERVKDALVVDSASVEAALLSLVRDGLVEDRVGPDTDLLVLPAARSPERKAQLGFRGR